MKSLKITLLLVTVLLLTVSGQSSETIIDTNETSYKEYSPKNLLAIDKKEIKSGVSRIDYLLLINLSLHLNMRAIFV